MIRLLPISLAGLVALAAAHFATGQDRQPRSLQEITLGGEARVPGPRTIPLQLETVPLQAAVKPFFATESGVLHRRLYFEQPSLERDGHCLPWQDFRSGLTFGINSFLCPFRSLAGQGCPCQRPQGLPHVRGYGR